MKKKPVRKSKDVDVVQIIVDSVQQPYPGTYIYVVHVLAKITLPSNDCSLTTATATIRSGGGTLLAGPTSIATPTGNPNWYTTSQLPLYSCHPGDTISALVDAHWICPGGANSSGTKML